MDIIEKFENGESEQQKLICSDEFEEALVRGSDIRSEISGTMKQRSKNNYERFYEIMLACNPEIQAICDKRKKDRRDDENNSLKKFIKETKMQYKIVRDLIFLDEDDSHNDDGTTNNVPKKLAQLVERIALAYPLLKYVGLSDVMEGELNRRGVHISTTPLELRCEAFENEQIRSDMKETFEESCKIQSEIDGAEREIRENVFTNMVPAELQFDKEHNPGGIRDSDFKKLVDIKYKMVKSKSADEEAKEKATEKAFDEAEKKTFDIQRSMIVRTGLMAMGADASQYEDSEDD